MTSWTVSPTLEADIDVALERARLAPRLPQAVAAIYDHNLDLIVITLDTKHRVVIARENLQGLEHATPEQMAHIEVFGGLDIAWPKLDLDHYLPALMQGIYGSQKWMEQFHAEPVAA